MNKQEQLERLSSLKYKGTKDPLTLAAIKATGKATIGNQDWMNLYLAINGPSESTEVRKALCHWRGAPSTWYVDYFKARCNKNFYRLPPDGGKIKVGLTSFGLESVAKVAHRVGIELDPTILHQFKEVREYEDMEIQ